MPSIFEKQRSFTAAQLRTVAQRRFRDAEALAATKDNERANGAMYMGGFVIEILLKAMLVSSFPSSGTDRVTRPLSNEENNIRGLVWGSHNLDQLAGAIPQFEAALDAKGGRAGLPYLNYFRSISAVWTVYARYSPFSTTVTEAQEMIEKVRNLKEVLQ